jgi:hypothetical protein
MAQHALKIQNVRFHAIVALKNAVPRHLQNIGALVILALLMNNVWPSNALLDYAANLMHHLPTLLKMVTSVKEMDAIQTCTAWVINALITSVCLQHVIQIQLLIDALVITAILGANASVPLAVQISVAVMMVESYSALVSSAPVTQFVLVETV